MKVGVGLPNTLMPRLDRGLLLDWARTAERLGFYTLAVIDKPNYDSWDPLITLAPAAAGTAAASADLAGRHHRGHDQAGDQAGGGIHLRYRRAADDGRLHAPDPRMGASRGQAGLHRAGPGLRRAGRQPAAGAQRGG